MNELVDNIVRTLLEIGAVKFNFKEPFIWASGLKSPVYCDNRASLSNHNLRSMVRDAYVEIIKDKFPDVEVIAGVATGAIAQGALVADKLGLPFAYVREKRKEHGLNRIVEGNIEKGQKAVIIEDHISTGGSCLRALEELKKEEVNVLGVVAAFSYGFPTELEQHSKLETISTFSTIRDVALKEGYITKEEDGRLIEWYKAPKNYEN